MTVLVTGASGFIGAAVVRALSQRGEQVVCPLRRHVPELQGLRRVTCVTVDCLDPVALRQAVNSTKPKVVIHLTASGVRPSERDPVALAQGNVGTLAALLQAAQDWPLTRLVHIGSVAELGDPGALPCNEDTPLAPISAYGGAKAAATTFGCGVAAALGLPFVVLRLFGTFGIGEAPARLLPHLCRHLLRGEPVPLTSGEQIRDFTWIDDVVAAILRGADATLPAGSLYHVCSGRGQSVRQVGERMAQLLGASPDLLQWGAVPQRSDEPAVLIGDPRRFLAATGWRATTSLDAAIDQMAAYVRGTRG